MTSTASGSAGTVDFDPISGILISFKSTAAYPTAGTELNDIYSSDLPNFERIFTDPTTREDILADTQLGNTLRQAIIDDVIVPSATATTDPNDIRSKINPATLQISCGDGFLPRRVTKNAVIRCFRYAIKNDITDNVVIWVGINHIYFRPDITYTNWSDTDMSLAGPFVVAAAAPPPAATAPPLTTADVATAVTSSMTAALPGIGTAIATAITAAPPAAAAAAPAATPVTTRITTAENLWTFNEGALPAPVRTRYQAKKSRRIMGSSIIHNPYRIPGGDPYDGFYYWSDNKEKVVLADGTLFFYQAIDERSVMKHPILCEKDTHVHVRKWYEMFTEHLHQHGIYVHPLWLFKKDHGGEWGFTIGDDPADDIPQRMNIIVHRTSNLVFQILSIKDMFPKDSRLKNLVAQCSGNGYKALKAVIFKSHPGYHESPSTLISGYPRQRDQSLLEFHNNFVDFQRLRAYIADIVKDLDDPGELEIFINNCKYSEFLQRVTRDERRVVAHQHKYRGTQLVETLEKYLMAADSPARREAINEAVRPRTSIPAPTRRFTPSPGRGNAIARNRTPVATRVNQIGSSHSDEAPGVSSTDSNESNESHESHNSFEEACVTLLDVEVPQDQWDVYDQYRVAINSIRRDPNLVESPTCIVCDQTHRFADCPVLNNADFLRQHYIRYCQLANRERALRASAAQSNQRGTQSQSRTQGARVNLLDIDDFDNLMRDDVDRDIEDFQNGRS